MGTQSKKKRKRMKERDDVKMLDRRKVTKTRKRVMLDRRKRKRKGQRGNSYVRRQEVIETEGSNGENDQ